MTPLFLHALFLSRELPLSYFDPLYVICLSEAAFKVFFSSLALSKLIMMYLAVIFFMFLGLELIELHGSVVILSLSNLENFGHYFFSFFFSVLPSLSHISGTPLSYVFSLLKLAHSSLIICSFYKILFLLVFHSKCSLLPCLRVQ